ncbi:MAG: hypothetical protein AAGE92_09015 [Cyanobacteria bacterium P01_G01_bin.4]
MVTEAEDQWLVFLDTLADVMVKFETDQSFSMDEAYSSLSEFRKTIDPEFVEFAEDTISEIGGFPKGYAEVLNLAKNRVPKDVFKRYMMA